MADEQNQTQETEVEALKRQLGERDSAFGKMKTQFEEQLAARDSALTDAAAKYQALLVQTNPEVPAELIKGITVTELEASLASGKALVNKVKESLEAQAQSAPIPPGAPTRQAPDLSGLSPQAKIIEGLKQHDRRK